MGALTINRKRRDEYYTLDRKLPSSYCIPSEDNHISKKPRISSSLNPSSDQPISSKNTEIRVSRVYQYPKPGNQIRREVHAPCTIHKLGFLSSLNRNLRLSKEGFADVKGSIPRFNYGWARSHALEAIRYFEKDKEVIDVDVENYENDVLIDSSIEKFDQAKNHSTKILKYWKKDKEVIDVDAQNYNNDVLTNSSIEEAEFVEDEVVPNVQESDGKIVDRDFQPSSSTAVSDLTKVEYASISLEQKLEKLELLGMPLHKKLRESAERRNPKLNNLSFQIKLNEKRLDTIRLLRPAKRVVEDVLQDVLREPFLPLTEEDEAEVSRALSKSFRRRVLVTHEDSNIEITGELLQCLKPGAWLNDEVINLFLELLKEREKRVPKNFLKCHFFNTFFYKKLFSGRNGYDFKSVRRWTTQRKLGYCLRDCDKIFVPIHKEIHWCLAVINMKDQKFQYLDSLGGFDTQVLKVLARYLVDEVNDKSGDHIDVSSWSQEYVEDLPEQENGWDCGMFMIKYADFYSRGFGLHFNQEHMPYFRLRTAKEILRLKAE